MLWTHFIFALSLVAVTHSETQIEIKLECQAGWTQLGQKCYRLYTDPVSWTTAERVCNSYGATLAAPLDYWENEEVGSFVIKANVDEFWIGANRIGLLPNNNRNLNFNGRGDAQMWMGHWFIDQPVFQEGECVSIIQDKKGLHKWKFSPCENKLSYICQRPVCSQGSFHCINGQCINPSLKCDQFDDCGDGSDEIDCPSQCHYSYKVSGFSSYVFPISGLSIPSNADCSWRLEGDLGYNIELKIDSMSLEDGKDELILLEGGYTESNSVELKRLTGQPTSAQLFYSANNVMIVKFRSYSLGSSTSFRFTVNQVKFPDLKQTNKLIANNSWQVFEFPFYKRYQLGNQDYIYIIQAESAQQIVTVEILDLDLAPDSAVIFRDGETVISPLLSELKGSYRGNGFVLSTSRNLYISLQTVRGSSNRGIKIQYRQGCDLTIRQSSGYISSSYTNGLTCRFKVVAGVPVSIKIERMSLLSTDQLKILDDQQKVLQSYPVLNSALTTTRIENGSFTVSYLSSSTMRSDGFNLTFSQDCPKLVLTDETVIIGAVGSSYLASFNVTCQSGSKFYQEEHVNKSSVKVTCEAHGSWNIKTSPRCQRVYCPLAPTLNNGYVFNSTGNLAYGNTVTYRCNSGFTLHGTDTITCGSEGIWSPMPFCNATLCSTPPAAPANGNQTIIGPGNSFGSVIRFSCNEGFDLIGVTTMFCDTSFTWKGNVPECRRLRCHFNNVTNGFVNSMESFVGETIALTCSPGYQLSPPGNGLMTCGTDRKLSPAYTCEDIDECNISNPCAHICQNIPGSFICSCKQGFQLLGTQCIDINECDQSPCHQNCNNTPGLYQCSCRTGFVLFTSDGSEGYKLPLSETGLMAGDIYRINHTCVAVVCPQPPLILNSDQLTKQSSFHFNDTVRYKCKLGYKLQDPQSNFLTCGENRTWLGPNITCSRARCFIEPAPANLINAGKVSQTSGSVNFGEEITIACNVPGLKVSSFTRKRKCSLIDGEYKLDGNPSDYECGFISCGKPKEEPGSIYSGLSSYFYGNSFTFGCNANFTLTGWSTLSRNATVQCTAQGVWDFGNLSCTGVQCVDPGQPYLGYQNVSDYREGQKVSFNCKKSGFESQPPFPISCRVDTNGAPTFNASLPRCVDILLPNISNCPVTNLVASTGQSLASIVPKLILQDNGGIKSLKIRPAFPSSNYFIQSSNDTKKFSFILSDYANNVAVCNMTIVGKDYIPPSILCPSYEYNFTNSSNIIITYFNSTNVNVSDNVSPLNKLLVNFSTTSFTFEPAKMLFASFPPTFYQTIQASVTDEASNEASCTFGLFYKPDTCSPFAIRKNLPGTTGTPNCTPVGSGYSCTISCLNGFRLYNDITKTAQTVTCGGPGQPFTPDANVKCIDPAVEGNRASFHMVYNFTYTGKNVSSSCRTSYQFIIQNVLDNLNLYKNITKPCEVNQIGPVQTARIELGEMFIDEKQQQISVQYLINFDRQGWPNYKYCAQVVDTYFSTLCHWYPLLCDFTPLQCEQFKYYNQSRSYDFFCPDPSSKLVMNADQSEGYCLSCLEGTYKSSDKCIPCSRGTFSMIANASQCTKCPANTSTYTEGSTSNTECVAECVSGSISSSGLPPCQLCPKNTYWQNATSCSACPAKTMTLSNGAHTRDQCRAICPPGQFNEVNGYGDCKPCPRHTYSDKEGTTSCIPCDTTKYTVNEGSNNVAQCLTLMATNCVPNCKNGNCVQLIPHVHSCVCNDGWTGENCSESFDPCESTPCQNNGTCIRNNANFTCTCLPGTSGSMCENIIPTCSSNYCSGKGSCENLVNMAKCHCFQGYSGERCDIAEDICKSQPCSNGGVCTSLGMRYVCSCADGWTGINCNDSIDDCYTRPCRNNGTCVDGQNVSSCNCATAPGYDGIYCDQRKTFCSFVNCGPGAVCVEDEINSSYICVCDESAEYRNDSTLRTCVSKRFCDSTPCKNNGTCINTGLSYTCQCLPGFEGSQCQHNVDDCRNNPCRNGGLCVDRLNGFTCDCTSTGYEGTTCESKIDYCSANPCQNGAQCISSVHDYQCNCAPGWTGRNCVTNVDDCAASPCLHNGVCQDQVNGYFCVCLAGWSGKDCSVEENQCSPAPCGNEATCLNLFNDYFCSCQSNTYGKNCSSRASICQVTNTCLNNGKCAEHNGVVQCTCPTNYTGTRCELVKNFCSSDSGVCSNGAQCFASLDGYLCQCQPGYTGTNCEVNLESCSTANCVRESQCIDMEDRAYCRCLLSMEGPACDRNWNQDFDLFFENKQKSGTAYLSYPVPLNSTAFSLAFWVQFGDRGDTGTIVSVYEVPKANSLRDKTLLLSIDETSVYYRENDGRVVTIKHDISYHDDGKWHYLVVNVNRATGELNFIVDVVNSLPAKITVGTFDLNLWFVLGGKYNPANDSVLSGQGFYGKMSRFTVYSRVLQHREEVTIEGNNNVSALFPNSILRWSSEFKYSVGVRRLTPSTADQSCQFGYANYPACDTFQKGKNKVTVVNGTCPGDILMYSQNRLAKVSWNMPVFTGQAAVNSSIMSDDIFVWGKYPVVVQGANSDGNKALCIFNIYVQNDQCSVPEKPANVDVLQCLPLTYENYRQCAISCVLNTAPSIPGPLIHTCGPVGNWDPPNKFVPYRISPCGGISQPRHRLIIRLMYTVPTTECGPVKGTLGAELLKTQRMLNGLWDKVCISSNCSDTIISVNCINSRRKRQVSSPSMNLEASLILNDILNQVTSRNNSSIKLRTEDLYKNLILQMSNNPFNYSNLVSDASPVGYNITLEFQCQPPTVLNIHNQCVDCGPGTFYNASVKECQFCPIGFYQPSSGQTSCFTCNAGSTTQQIGASNSTSCKPKCQRGQYFEVLSNDCRNCSVGYYQPSAGEFSCLSCPADKTTKYTGSVSSTDCSNDCPPGEEIGVNNNCTSCAIGFYRSVNDPYCQRCSAFVTLNTSSTSSTDCKYADNPAGTYRNPNDTRTFLYCEIGYYQPRQWQFSCISCGDLNSYHTESPGATSQSQCKFYCPPGQQKKPNVDVCEQCPIGSYRNGSRKFDLCDSCPKQYTTSQSGAIAESNCSIYQCPAGQQPNPTNNGCIPCTQGTYQPIPDKSSCLSCPPGTSTRFPGALSVVSCETYCPSGFYKNDQAVCQACNIGYFKDNNIDVFSNCTRCLNSSYVTANISSVSNDNCTVLNCVEGYFTNQAANVCEACAKGSYQDKKYQGSCIACPSDQSTRRRASTKLSDCETFCPSGFEKQNSSCKSCHRGFYKDNSVDLFMSCTACNASFVTPNSSSTSASDCTVPNCKAGSYITGSVCSNCSKGEYQDELWQTSCKTCPPDRDTETVGAVSFTQCLLNCSVGKENLNGSSECVECSPGYYKDHQGSTRCKPCSNLDDNDIKISTKPGATSFSDCSKLVCRAGFYPMNSCIPCDYGFYQPDKWQDQCIACGANLTTYFQGSTNASDCEVKCQKGQEVVNRTCQKCSIGFYSDKKDPSRKSCLGCPFGLITADKGADDIALCSITDCTTPGQYRNPTDNKCHPCPVGSYQDTIRQDTCKLCPPRTTTQLEGSSSISSCRENCSVGSEFSTASNSCVQCAKGFYRPLSSWTCLPCGPGLTTPGTGSVSPADCSQSTCVPGQRYDGTGCSNCPVNTYQDIPSQRDCKPCPPNQITADVATTSILGCLYPCSMGNKCSIVGEECINDNTVKGGFRCQCALLYENFNNHCTHKCDITNYCGEKGTCLRSTGECKCADGYKGSQCDIRPNAEALSEKENQTILIAVITTICGVLFLILLIVCICVMTRRRAPRSKAPMTTEFDERASIATRSMKGYDDYPTFAVNPAFSSKPSSTILGGPLNTLPSQSLKMFNNPTFTGDEDNDPAVYRA